MMPAEPTMASAMSRSLPLANSDADLSASLRLERHARSYAISGARIVVAGGLCGSNATRLAHLRMRTP